jgi:hypothetical protein
MSQKHQMGKVKGENDLLSRRLREIEKSAREALEWWKAANESIGKLTASMLIDLKKIIYKKLGFFEWLCYSPFIGFQAIGRIFVSAPRIRRNTIMYEHNFFKWQIEAILGGEERMSVETAAKQLAISEDRVRSLLKELQGDKKKAQEEEQKRQEEQEATAKKVAEEQRRKELESAEPLMIEIHPNNIFIEENSRTQCMKYQSMEGDKRAPLHFVEATNGVKQLQSAIITDHKDYPSVKIKFYVPLKKVELEEQAESSLNAMAIV